MTTFKQFIYRLLHPKLSKQLQLVEAKRTEYRAKVTTGNPLTYTVAAGLQIQLYPKGQIAEQLYTVDFEHELLELYCAFLKPGMNIIDVGANIGLYSILGSKLIGSSGKIWAFEPAADTTTLLNNNLKLNGVQNVVVVQQALSFQDGQVISLVRDSGFGDAERYLDTTHTLTTPDTQSVTTIRLDSYLQTQVKAPIKIDFMKVDVEGAELFVFQGAKAALQANPQVVIMFENSPFGCERAGYTQNDLLSFLRTVLGLTIYAWDGTHKRWQTDDAIIRQTGNVWACRDSKLLPVLA